MIDATLLARPPYAAFVRSMPALLGYWRLGERAGTTARDELGLHDGTYVGSPALGVTGALADGDTATTTAVNKVVTHGAVTFTGNPRSVGCWVNTISAVTSGVVTNRNNALVNAYQITLLTTQIVFGVGNGASEVFVTDPLACNDGRWHLFVGTYDGVTLVLYRDGVRVVSGACSLTPSVQVFASFGRIWNTSTLDFSGSIDEVAIWDRPLTPGEIADMYYAGVGR